ncbi:MAG: branched-chain amino acid ABC transporter substrate-binding protein [Actinomycetota bacterium]
MALSAVALVAAGCAGEPGDGDGDGVACPDTELECIEVGPGEPIRIGTILTISGETASLGLDSQHGVELGADHLDGTFDGTFGQIAGHDVEFQHEDGGCSAEGGTAAGQKLASDPTIAAVIGTSCSSSALGTADTILSDQGLVLFSPSNTSPALTDPATHQPFYARTAHNDKIQGAAVAQFAGEELNVSTAATIHDGSPYADGLQQVFCDVFTSQYGGECTAQEAIQVGDTDFSGVLTDIAAGNPEFLFFPIFLPEGGLITAQARENPDYADVDLAGADGLLTPDFIDSAGADNAEGVFMSGPSLEFAGAFYEDEFLPAYEDQFGEEPTAAFHAHSYDALGMLAQALEGVAVETDDGGLLIPKTQLKDALFAIEGFPGITGELTCDDNGDCQPTATMAVNEIQGGEFVSIFEAELTLEETS